MAPRIYIDGHAGTTGLRIRDWMADRRDVELLVPPEEGRKDPEVRRQLMPVTKKYPIEVLLPAVEAYAQAS